MRVSHTSTTAYHAEAARRETWQVRVARAILAATKDGKNITIAELAQKLRIVNGTVSGRIGDIRKKIDKTGAYLIDGTPYVLDIPEKRKSKVQGHDIHRSNAFVLIEKPAHIGVQTNFFAA